MGSVVLLALCRSSFSHAFSTDFESKGDDMAETNAFFLTEVETEARETVPVQVTGQKFLWPFSECWMISFLPSFLPPFSFFLFLTGRETEAREVESLSQVHRQAQEPALPVSQSEGV